MTKNRIELRTEDISLIGRWSAEHRVVLYPFTDVDQRIRTHDDYLNTAREALDRSRNGKDCSVDGVKGLSVLIKVFKYPDQILLDYMHMCCLGHFSTLAKRWRKQVGKSAIQSIDDVLTRLQLPHHVNVAFLDFLSLADQWKAKTGRLFILNVGVAIITSYLPKILASHFVIYAMAIKILHAPLSSNEIDFADRLILYYCETANFVHGASIEIFSLHAHLHLAEQVCIKYIFRLQNVLL